MKFCFVFLVLLELSVSKNLFIDVDNGANPQAGLPFSVKVSKLSPTGEPLKDNSPVYLTLHSTTNSRPSLLGSKVVPFTNQDSSSRVSDLVVEEAGQGYYIKAFAPGFNSSTSPVFSVEEAEAAFLRFETQPVAPFLCKGLVVSAFDLTGKNRVSLAQEVQLSLLGDSGTLLGTRQVIQDGRVYFSDCYIDTSGTFKLLASVEGLQPAVSEEFMVLNDTHHGRMLATAPSAIISNSYLSISEGETGTYTIKRSSGTGTVTITASGNIGVSPSSISVSTSPVTITVTVNSGPGSNTPFYYLETISHDFGGGIILETQVAVVNLCKPAVYNWMTQNTCSGNIDYFELDANNDPQKCNPGEYYSSGSCQNCEAGYYCPDGKDRIQCPTGYYQDSTGQSSCLKIDSGKHGSSATSAPSNTAAGKYTSSGYQNEVSCPSGAYCPNTDLPVAVPCSLGTYSEGDQASCSTCAAGETCDFDSSSSCSTYSPSGSYECMECPYSAECTTTGITLATEGQKVSGGITSCDADSVCSVLFNYQPVSCGPGYKPDSGSTCQPCDVNKNCLVGTESSCGTPRYEWGIACLDCPWPTQDGSPCSNASPTCGDYNWHPDGYKFCYECSPGFKCNSADSGPNSDECPANEYCEPGSNSPGTCPPGTYGTKQKKSDISECSMCEEGNFCSDTESQDQATEGKFSPRGAQGDNFQCPDKTSRNSLGGKSFGDCNACTGAGKTCSVGSGSPGYPGPTEIVSGSYAFGAYSYDWTTRKPCPAGKYNPDKGSDEESDCKSSPAGTYSLDGYKIPVLCPNGFYNPTADDMTCDRCSGGKICYAGDSDDTSRDCKEGYFCPRGTGYAKSFSCPSGFFNTATNSESMKDCSECTAGNFCEASSSADATTSGCAEGHYCPQGTPMHKRFVCELGSKSADANTYTQQSECQQCSAGKACMGGVEIDCAPGNFCEAGTERPDQYACPGGTYTASITLADVASCTACTNGNFCPPAAVKEFPCPEGTYENTGGADSIEDCLACTAGNYCDTTGTTTPTNCGAGNYCNEGATAALKCPRGYYCDSATHQESDMNVCTAGHLCPEGTSTVPGGSEECPAGYYCLQGTLVPFPCPPGTYRDTTGAAVETDCGKTPAGSFIDSFAVTTAGSGNCLAGHYCPEGSYEPIPCPPGTYRAATGATAESDCIACEGGTYCAYEGTSSTTACPAGNYCPKGSTAPTPCPIRTFDSSGGLTAESECTQCTEGSYCDEPGLTAVTGSCKAGYYCKLGSLSATPVGDGDNDICPKGSYCPEGAAPPSACSPGTFNNYEGATSDADCIACPRGFYCDSADSPEPTGPCDEGWYCEGSETSAQPTGKKAPVGKFAPQGSPAPIKCERGTYQDQEAQGDCKDCDAGKYCPDLEMSSPTDCPKGYYCPLKSISPIPCPPGTFRDSIDGQQLSDCSPCTAGKYCETYGLEAVSGDCAAGYFCEIGSPYEKPAELVDDAANNKQYGPCPVGHYCEQGTTSRNQNPCDAGKYNPSELGESAADCLECTAGRYCSGTGNSDDSNLCDAGHHCPEGSDSATANSCTAGHYCPQGSAAEIECLPGYYQDGTQASTCKNCPTGSFCPRGSQDHASNTCPIGHYCPLNTIRDKQYPCEPGKYNTNTGSTSDAACIACDAGKYCDVYGIGDISSNDCSPGFYCSGQAIVSKPMDGSSYGGICKRGQYCPGGIDSAQSCDAGKYCAKEQLGAVQGDCTEGYYCSGSTKVPTPNSLFFTNGDICPKGHYCPEASGDKTACGAGKYLPYTGAIADSECIDCPPGYYCPNTGTDFPANKCPVGYYCPAGTQNANANECTAGHYCPEGSHEQIKCPAGKYQDLTGQGSCKDCTAGNYCEEGADSETTCPAGYYCPDNTGYRHSYPCPVGTFNPDTGSDSIDDCQACTAGSYCDSPGINTVTGNCAAGYYCSGSAIIATPIDTDTGGICPLASYCPESSTSPTDCDAGKYCNQQGLSSPVADCYKGFYCNAKSTTAVPTDGTMGNICSAGKYCAAGSSSETDCGVGKYSPAVGLFEAAECLDCPHGKYCETAGLTSPTGDCSAGYYCDGGQNVASPSGKECTVGSYCEEGSFEAVPCQKGKYQDDTSQSSCKDCTSGKYCEGGNHQPEDCPIGHYCPANTRFDKEFPCEAGTYSDSPGQSACTDCSPGKQCAPGAENEDEECPNFSYCPIRTGWGLICPEGTYNDASTGLTAPGECTNCPEGKYCVDGRVSGDCEAGYWCEGGSPTPTPTGTNPYGQQCPKNYYCQKGTTDPTPCPDGKFRKLVGGRQESDCTECPPGSYCVPGNPEPVTCPRGYYCPQGVQSPIPCPEKTYGSEEGSDSDETCLVCPAGYKCTNTGISNFGQYECGEIGHYCVPGSLSGTPCPAGTYSDSMKAGSVDDCNACPAGNYCPGASADIFGCPAGTYCPTGSPEPIPCSVGYYCHENATQPIICPSGHYCPKYNQTSLDQYQNQTQPPIPCPSGSICPEGSFEPDYCEPGYSVKETTCEKCEPGTHNRGWASNCALCEAGYICVLGAIKPDPVSEQYDGGYECPRGHYCLKGAIEPTPCPKGTYNPYTTQPDESSCLPCPSDTYSDTEGNWACLPCGTSAGSSPGSTTCVCEGANRAYQKSDGSCRCLPTYEFYINGVSYQEDDSTIDCIPIVFPYCSENQIRDPFGNCKEENDCEDDCNGGEGTRMPGVGLCECKDVKSIDDICNKSCRDNSLKTYFRNGQFEVYDPQTGEYQALDITGNEYYGLTECEGECKTYSMDMTESGPEAVYGLGSSVASKYVDSLNLTAETSRRLQEVSTESARIPDPVICIQKGETFVFSINGTEHYPVYVKDSLINTNPNFDYGAFKELKRILDAETSTISTFAFTFTQKGIYDFVDNVDPSKHMVVSVMGDGEQCPDSNIPLRTRTKSSLLTFGTQSNESIIKDPDWIFILTTILWMALLMTGMVGLIYFFHHQAWKQKTRAKQSYRVSNMHLDIASLSEPPKEQSVDAESSVKKANDEAEFPVHEDIDPSIFQAMYSRLQEQGQIIANEPGASKLNSILNRLGNLKQYLKATLGNLAELSVDSDDETNPHQEAQQAVQSLFEKYDNPNESLEDKQELVDKIANNPNLSDQDKEDLISDFNANLQRIELALESEKSRAQDILNQRLQKRAAKRSQEGLTKEEEKQIQTEFEEQKKEIDQTTQAKYQLEYQDLQEKLEKKLKSAPDKKQSRQYMNEFKQQEEKLRKQIDQEKSKQYEELYEKIKARKLKRKANKPIPLSEIEPEEEEKLQELSESQEQAKNQLIQTQQEEKQRIVHNLQNSEFKLEEEQRNLQEEISKAADSKQKAELLKQLEDVQKALSEENSSQKSGLQERLRERQRARVLKNLKTKHSEQKSQLQNRFEEETQSLNSELLNQKISRVLSTESSPEETAQKVKDLIDEKQQNELAALSFKKQSTLTQRQTELLQDQLANKASEVANLRSEFRQKRQNVQDSDLPSESKEKEINNLHKKESEALNLIDYRFINNLSREQQELLKQVEEEFKQKYMQLADKHLAETTSILEKMRTANPQLLNKHMTEAQQEAQQLRNDIENDYQNKLSEINQRQQELESMQGEREREIEELQKQLEETEAKKRELAEVEEKRKEMAAKQREMVEEMRRRGISEDQVEQMIKQHQDQMTEWERAMEEERKRQRDILQQKLDARIAKHQQKIAAQIAKYKEDNNKIIQSKEEEKLTIKLSTGREMKLHYPLRNLSTKLRVKTLPVLTRKPVQYFPDYSENLQTLLEKVRRIEKIVENVDLNQFEAVMQNLGNITGLVKNLSKA